MTRTVLITIFKLAQQQLFSSHLQINHVIQELTKVNHLGVDFFSQESMLEKILSQKIEEILELDL